MIPNSICQQSRAYTTRSAAPALSPTSMPGDIPLTRTQPRQGHARREKDKHYRERNTTRRAQQAQRNMFNGYQSQAAVGPRCAEKMRGSLSSF